MARLSQGQVAVDLFDEVQRLKKVKQAAIRYISALERYRRHIEDHEPGTAWFTKKFERELDGAMNEWRSC